MANCVFPPPFECCVTCVVVCHLKKTDFLSLRFFWCQCSVVCAPNCKQPLRIPLDLPTQIRRIPFFELSKERCVGHRYIPCTPSTPYHPLHIIHHHNLNLHRTCTALFYSLPVFLVPERRMVLGKLENVMFGCRGSVSTFFQLDIFLNLPVDRSHFRAPVRGVLEKEKGYFR